MEKCVINGWMDEKLASKKYSKTIKLIKETNGQRHLKSNGDQKGSLCKSRKNPQFADTPPYKI
jgi:hypothetical protein